MTNEGILGLEVLCNVNGHMKKLQKKDHSIGLYSGKEKMKPKTNNLSKFANKIKIKHEGFGGTYINFMISAVGSVIKIH